MMDIIDDFMDHLADDIGVRLSLGETDPVVDRFVNACLSDDAGKWITIGGKHKGDEKHAGGFRVQIDGRGNIVKGRMKGTNLKDVKAKFDEKKDVGRPIREKEEHSKMPSFMRNGEQKQNIPRNPIDISRNDDKISPVEQQTSGDKGEKMERTTKKYWQMSEDEYRRAMFPDRTDNYRKDFTSSAIADIDNVPQEVIDNSVELIYYKSMRELKNKHGEDFAKKLTDMAHKVKPISGEYGTDSSGKTKIRRRQEGNGFVDLEKGDIVETKDGVRIVNKAGKCYVERHDGEISGYFQDVVFREPKKNEANMVKRSVAARNAVYHGGEPRNQDYPDLKVKQMKEYHDLVNEALS